MKNNRLKINVINTIMLCIGVAVIISIVSSCNKPSGSQSLTPNEITAYNNPKYIFFFIGDGMATAQVNLAQAMVNNPIKNTSEGEAKKELPIEKFPVAGMATTYAQNRYITGSAAAATALATGNKTTIGTISKNSDHTKNLKTIAEMAKEKSMRVGIVTSVSIDHATPACFYAHENSRNSYNNIASQMATSGFDYFGGGYAKGNLQKCKDEDPEGDPKDIVKEMKNAGYKIVTTRTELKEVQPGMKYWAYNHTTDKAGALFYEIDRPKDHISLAEFTQKGIELLDNKNGFFMMVEGGKIDWACHANDAVSAARDVAAFNDAIATAIEFYNKHKDETLIIVTGDHECGGLALGFSGTEYRSVFHLLKRQKISFSLFADKVKSWSQNTSFEMALDSIANYFGIGKDIPDSTALLSEYEIKRLKTAYEISLKDKNTISKTEKKALYGTYEPLTVTVTHILNNKVGLDWTSYSHTGIPVPVFALGQGQYEFSGYYDNTDIPAKIMRIAKLKDL